MEYIDQYGVKYSEDRKTLIGCPCEFVGSYSIPPGVTSIKTGAFGKCPNLTHISIPLSVTHIGEYAFSECESLTNVYIPGTVIELGRGAFNKCTNLESANIPSSLTEVQKYMFIECKNLKSVAIDGNIKKIGIAAFMGCESLNEIVLPDTVEYIEAHAFDGCSKLTKIELTDNVVHIGEYAFSKCKNLHSIHLGRHITDIAKCTFFQCSLLQNLIIPHGVQSIGKGAFAFCEKLDKVEIPNSVTIVDDYAFRECTSLTKINIGKGVSSIGNYAFADCGIFKGFERIIIPSNVRNIGKNAFANIDKAKIIDNTSKGRIKYFLRGIVLSLFRLLGLISIPIIVIAFSYYRQRFGFNINEIFPDNLFIQIITSVLGGLLIAAILGVVIILLTYGLGDWLLNSFSKASPKEKIWYCCCSIFGYVTYGLLYKYQVFDIIYTKFESLRWELIFQTHEYITLIKEESWAELLLTLLIGGAFWILFTSIIPLYKEIKSQKRIRKALKYGIIYTRKDYYPRYYTIHRYGKDYIIRLINNQLERGNGTFLQLPDDPQVITQDELRKMLCEPSEKKSEYRILTNLQDRR